VPQKFVVLLKGSLTFVRKLRKYIICGEYNNARKLRVEKKQKKARKNTQLATQRDKHKQQIYPLTSYNNRPGNKDETR